jgi:hypothetical protein
VYRWGDGVGGFQVTGGQGQGAHEGHPAKVKILYAAILVGEEEEAGAMWVWI